MLFSKLLQAGAFAVLAAATPISVPHSVHEKRLAAPPGWAKREVLDRRAILPMRIGLKQSNLEKGYEWLMDVSHPESEKFGQHWTSKQVAEAFAPSTESVKAVKSWLASAGISNNRVKHSQGLSWLTFDATVDEAEELLRAKYHVYEHEQSGKPHVACEEYSIPSHLKEHVDLVYPTVHFDSKIDTRESDRDLEKRDTNKGVGRKGGWWNPKGGWRMPHHSHNPFADLSTCDEYIVPNCLRALYKFPVNSKANPKNSYGIVEYTPESYIPSDLDLFFKNFSTRQVGNRPIFDSIDGGVLYFGEEDFSINGESDLDLEYAMTLVYPQQVTLYQVGDLVEGASFNNFLDAIDGSYCSYDGGDDPNQDGTYPDPLSNGTGAYKGPENCGGFSATKVISTSYGYNEHSLTPFYEMRQCHEYMKLGMMGVSILYSSGDYGVAGNGGQCIAANGTFNSGLDGRFNPAFPSTCPYVTAVGATQVKPNTSIVADLATGTQPEEACETVIYSGGGFSNVFSLPSYQASAVHSWFKNFPPPYGADRFNNSQQTRGYPDISANGANYVIAVDGNFSLVFGTSASSPTFGSILTLINQERLNVGKSSVGFINPTAYAHPYVFNDITEGGNQGCGTPGFMSAPGWDPVTGLGTPNYPKMSALWLSLP